ncbi:YccF domain-containing protein [Kitasatospora sp. NPDC089797]|uniref:YccF domain-containing protein n=1 Tax=Kitasatospora sp. NPDC089797 TaxID=3155298 RepID=UPI00343F1C81
MKPINFVLNVIWLLFCGIWMAIGYAIAGIICCVLIVTIPFGIASFRIAGFILWPFGRTTVERRDAGAASCVGNVIWLVFAGWWLAIAHLVTSIPLFLSIIGIPFGWANLKMIPISLMPLGREIVSTDEAWGARY